MKVTEAWDLIEEALEILDGDRIKQLAKEAKTLLREQKDAES